MVRDPKSANRDWKLATNRICGDLVEQLRRLCSKRLFPAVASNAGSSSLPCATLAMPPCAHQLWPHDSAHHRDAAFDLKWAAVLAMQNLECTRTRTKPIGSQWYTLANKVHSKEKRSLLCHWRLGQPSKWADHGQHLGREEAALYPRSRSTCTVSCCGCHEACCPQQQARLCHQYR